MFRDEKKTGLSSYKSHHISPAGVSDGAIRGIKLMQALQVASCVRQVSSVSRFGQEDKHMAVSVNYMKDAMVHMYEEANRGNLEVFGELLAPNFVGYGGAGFQDLHGVKSFKDLYTTFLSAMPDLSFRVEQMIAEGDMIAVRGTLSGTHEGNFMGMAAATHKKITWTGTAFFRFNEQGLTDARWQEWDGMQVMQQMGVIPTPPGGDVVPPVPVPPYIPGAEATSPSWNKATVRRFIDEVWNKGNLAVADEVFHPEATSPSAPTLPKGPAAVRMLTTMFRSAMPDYHMDIIDIVADGDLVCARFTQSGTQTGELMGIPATGRKATWGEIGVLRFSDGKIVESFYNVDMLALFQGLGIGGDNSVKG